jgi:hypothetical protein
MSKPLTMPRAKRIKGKALRAGGCRWPAWGDQERSTQLFCPQPAAPGKVYCAFHWKIAHNSGVKV